MGTTLQRPLMPNPAGATAAARDHLATLTDPDDHANADTALRLLRIQQDAPLFTAYNSYALLEDHQTLYFRDLHHTDLEPGLEPPSAERSEP